MKKIIIVVFYSFTLSLLAQPIGNANSIRICGSFQSEEPMTIEELHDAMCYIEIDVAIKQFETEFKTKVDLPKEMPYEIKLKYGKVENDQLNLVFIGENKLDIFNLSIEKGFLLENERNYILANGTPVSIRDAAEGQAK